MREFAGDELPVTDELARTILALPMGPELDAEQAGKLRSDHLLNRSRADRGRLVHGEVSSAGHNSGER